MITGLTFDISKPFYTEKEIETCLYHLFGDRFVWRFDVCQKDDGKTRVRMIPMLCGYDLQLPVGVGHTQPLGGYHPETHETVFNVKSVDYIHEQDDHMGMSKHNEYADQCELLFAVARANEYGLLEYKGKYDEWAAYIISKSKAPGAAPAIVVQAAKIIQKHNMSECEEAKIKLEKDPDVLLHRPESQLQEKRGLSALLESAGASRVCKKPKTE